MTSRRSASETKPEPRSRHASSAGGESARFTPERVRRPREQVEAQIYEAIVSGMLRPGDKLPSETALAERFFVSRTTIREALRSLASVGFITKVPGLGGGSFVKNVDHHALGSTFGDALANTLRLGSITADELHVVRRLLEPRAASLAAEHRTETQLAFIESIINREKGATVDDPSISDLDISFHSAVAEASQNRPLLALVSALHRVARPVAMIELSTEVGRRTVRQHLAVVRAIQRRDSDGAAKAMGSHLDYIESLARSQAPT